MTSTPAEQGDVPNPYDAREQTVFHGTRVSAAEAILIGGFAPTTVDEQVNAVAHAHGVPVDDIWSDLREYSSFATSDRQREGVSVVAKPGRAGSWADRAPEATWEALWAVYRLRHPELGVDWVSSREGELWVLAQRMQDPPAVLVATTTLGDMHRTSFGSMGSTAAHGLLKRVANGGDIDRALNAIARAPEWRIAAVSFTPIEYIEIPIRVSRNLLQYFSGESDDTFRQQLHEGEWGEPGDLDSFDVWFPLHVVWPKLNPDRRSLLQETAGQPINPTPPTAGRVSD